MCKKCLASSRETCPERSGGKDAAKFWRDLADVGSEQERRGRRDPRLPQAGTTLERHYQGKTVCVNVLQDGFEYDGKPYESLSSIASSVSGTRWNGFAFFRCALQQSAVNCGTGAPSPRSLKNEVQP